MILSRRFLPYFITQCLGVLNDNLYKNVLILFVTYTRMGEPPMATSLFLNVAAGLFILPFFLFSAHAGAIADNSDKSRLIRRLKILEVIIMLCAAAAMVLHSYLILLVLLFLTGSQSAYFGSVKYSLLPQALKERELVSGNARVEMGTFIAILAGTLSAGLIAGYDHSPRLAACIVVAIAVLGYLSSRAIPALTAAG